VDYSRAANYDTPYRGAFDPDLMPFWKEPLEALQDNSIREVAILKSSRAGYSENLILTDLRYTIARNPGPTMYVTGKMEIAKGFHDRRVCRGMALSKEIERQYKRAKVLNTEIQFPAMDFRSTWATSDTAIKSDGWCRLYLDEVDLFPEFGVDMARRRVAAYPFSHICFGGSIDPSRKGDPNQSPIIKLYEESDKRVWVMPDPAGGEFEWTLGGIKWPKECKQDDQWDLEAVARQAWYETPNGTRIEESERMAYTRKGRWDARGEGIRRGYKVVAPMIPFTDCSFGELAKKFLSAKHRLNQTAKRAERNRNTIRTYMAEYWAEAHREEEQVATSDKLDHCAEEYEIGNIWVPEGWQSGIFATVDVQKYHLFWLCRNWAINKNGEYHSALVQHGTAATFQDLDTILAEYSPRQVGIDIGYALRQSEVADYCAHYADPDVKESAVMAMKGSDSQKVSNITYHIRDALEGRGGGASPFLELSWATDPFRTMLMDSIEQGNDWHIPDTWPDPRHKNQYIKQVTSTKKVDGEWIAPGHGQDHLWDCECMQAVLARWDGII